ncbi:MAG: DUF5676 family membrane protein [Nanoarchaeota archaeon]
MLNQNKFGLVIGCFFAVLHAVWALSVAIMKDTMQNFFNWIFNLHFLEPIWILTGFNLKDAILLIVVTFVVGFIVGWIFAGLYNLLSKKLK